MNRRNVHSGALDSIILTSLAMCLIGLLIDADHWYALQAGWSGRWYHYVRAENSVVLILSGWLYACPVYALSMRWLTPPALMVDNHTENTGNTTPITCDTKPNPTGCTPCRLYCLVKMIVGVSALMMSYEYFFYMIKYPSQKYYYIGDVVAWFLFSAIMVGEAFIQLTSPKPKREPWKHGETDGKP